MTSEIENSPWRVVEEPETAACLIDPRALTYLAPFVGRELTLSAAARELGVKLPRLHYQVTRLLNAGLLRITRTQSRGGSAVKHYSAVATAFFVPFETTDHETLEAAMGRATRAWQERFLRSVVRAALSADPRGRWGLRVYQDEGGSLVLEPGHAPHEPWDLLAPGSPAVLPGGWATDLRLDFEDAKALQRELAALRRKYLGRRGAQRYLLGLSLAPLDEERERTPRVQMT